jgi:hypothetical protein
MTSFKEVFQAQKHTLHSLGLLSNRVAVLLDDPQAKPKEPRSPYVKVNLMKPVGKR